MGIMDRTYFVRFLKEEDFASIIELGNRIHGDNYLSREDLEKILVKSKKGNLNCSFTFSLNEGDGSPERIIGFRLTYAPGQWINSFEKPLSPESWDVDPDKVAYLKCNTVDEEFQGKGFGRMLLDRSVAVCKRMGAEAAVAHIWMNSPDNSAYKYFKRAGGREVKIHPNFWCNDFDDYGFVCGHCGEDCDCSTTEMILDFEGHKELGHV